MKGRTERLGGGNDAGNIGVQVARVDSDDDWQEKEERFSSLTATFAEHSPSHQSSTREPSSSGLAVRGGSVRE
jgi:hypothetical protein